MAFATVVELKHHVQHDVDPTRAEQLLELVSSAVADAVGTDIAAATHTDTIDGTGAPTVTLPQWPVTAVTSVTVDGDLLDDDGWSWSDAGVLERTGGCWPDKRRAVVVVYDAGFDPVPDGVKLVVLKATARMLANPYGLQSWNGEGESAQFGPDDLHDREVAAAVRAMR